MKTTTIQELPAQGAVILDWLSEGETIILLNEGRKLARIVPEPAESAGGAAGHSELFRRRFAPLSDVPCRDLSGIVAENKGVR